MVARFLQRGDWMDATVPTLSPRKAGRRTDAPQRDYTYPVAACGPVGSGLGTDPTYKNGALA
jgi:hypothetical protein